MESRNRDSGWMHILSSWHSCHNNQPCLFFTAYHVASILCELLVVTLLPPHHTHCYQFVIAYTGQFEKVIFIILFTELPIASSCECLSYTVCDRKKKSHVVFPNGYFVVRPNTLTFLDHRIKITWWIKDWLAAYAAAASTTPLTHAAPPFSYAWVWCVGVAPPTRRARARHDTGGAAAFYFTRTRQSCRSHRGPALRACNKMRRF